MFNGEPAVGTSGESRIGEDPWTPGVEEGLVAVLRVVGGEACGMLKQACNQRQPHI